MRDTDIQDILDSRGYILEYDCAYVPTLSVPEIKKYHSENISSISIYVEDFDTVYALYNTNKITFDGIINRIKYKKSIANYLLNKAKMEHTIHYQVFNDFLNSMDLDYFDMSDVRFIIEEICTDFKPITNNHILSAILIKNNGISGSGFWDLGDIKRRIGTESKENFHKNELRQLKLSLSSYNCD